MFLDFVWPAPAEVPVIAPRRVEYQLDGVRVEVDAADVGSVPFEDCEPVRDFPTWPGKQHYHSGGYCPRRRPATRGSIYDFVTSGGFGSELEKACVVGEQDFCGPVVCVLEVAQ